MNLKNNDGNAEFFKRHVVGARLARGKGIPNKNIIHLNVSTEPKIKILANIQGSNNAKYVIDIFEENSRINIVHDCPDFKKNFKFCKHVVKVLLLLEPEICKLICKDVHKINFSSNFNLVKQGRTENFILKAEELIKKKKYYEAINFLEQAYNESNNYSYIEKIGEISLKYHLYDQFIKFAINFKKLIQESPIELSKLFDSLLDSLDNYEFFKQVEIILNLKILLKSLNERELLNLFQKLDIAKINNTVLKFVLLDNLSVQINIKGQVSKSQIEDVLLRNVEEAILDMDSEENLDAYLKIVNSCNFSIKGQLYNIIGKYKEKMKELFIDGLKQKHAYLRSLIIENLDIDKLPQMNIRYKHEYPTLVWTSTHRRESTLYYYVLEKCGIEMHHLEYTDQAFFIENYPVFKEIFDGNNPLGYKINNFWGTDNPKIKNVVKGDKIVEIDYIINLHELEKYVLIEWDLAQRPILGSYICQFSDGFIIPDKNHPLTSEIKPFDLILCYKKPIEIKTGNIKVLRPVRRINFKTAIELMWRGLEFISTYIPFEVVNNMKNYKIDEFDAYDHIEERFNTSFLPNKEKIKRVFFQFIQNKILRELNTIYLSILEKSDYKTKVLRMIGFKRFSEIFTNTRQLDKFKRDSLKRESLQILKVDFKNEIARILTDLIKKELYDEINLIELKKFSIYRKWTLKLIMELKKKLENCKIYREVEGKYDLQEFSTHYYGKIILDQLSKSGINLEHISENHKILIEENNLKQLLENYELLKIAPPKVIER